MADTEVKDSPMADTEIKGCHMADTEVKGLSHRQFTEIRKIAWNPVL